MPWQTLNFYNFENDSVIYGGEIKKQTMLNGQRDIEREQERERQKQLYVVAVTTTANRCSHWLQSLSIRNDDCSTFTANRQVRCLQ